MIFHLVRNVGRNGAAGDAHERWRFADVAHEGLPQDGVFIEEANVP